MSLQEFSRDVIPIVQAVLTAIGLLSLFLVVWQIRETRHWNKMSTVINLTDLDGIYKLEQDLVKSGEAISIYFGTLDRPINSDEIQRIRESEQALIAVKGYLGDLENLGTALSIGLADDDYARAIHGPRLAHAWKIFAPVIEELRRDAGGPAVYIELQKTALRWQERDLRDAHRNAAQIKNLEAKLQRHNKRIEKLRRAQENLAGAKARK